MLPGLLPTRSSLTSQLFLMQVYNLTSRSDDQAESTELLASEADWDAELPLPITSSRALPSEAVHLPSLTDLHGGARGAL